MVEDVAVKVGEGEVIYDPLHRIQHVLSCAEELGDLFDKAIVGDKCI